MVDEVPEQLRRFVELYCLDEVAAHGDLPDGCDVGHYLGSALIVRAGDGYALTDEGAARAETLRAEQGVPPRLP